MALALTAVLTAAGCSAGSTATSTGGSSSGGGDTKSTALTVGLVAEPASLDFTKVDGAAIPQVLLTNVYETLVKQDQDGKIVPDLATAWKVVRDRRPTRST